MYIICTDGPNAYYLIKGSGWKPYAWRRGPKAKLNALRFRSREEAQMAIDRIGHGAGGESPVVAEVVE